jgi:peptidyl-tRNA hydrolase, PTH1 family
MEGLSLVVGLGNPGSEYVRTRHNAGFMVVERVASRGAAQWSFEKKFNARVARIEKPGQRLLLAEPQTFMNASGETVGAVLRFYQLPVPQLLVVVDDADLPLGEIRMRPKGSSGGHHGLESIEQQVGTREFARLRVGIGRAAGAARQITNYVLGKFSPSEAALMEKVLDRAADQVGCWATEGAEKAMNRFNGVIDSEIQEA